MRSGKSVKKLITGPNLSEFLKLEGWYLKMWLALEVLKIAVTGG